MNLNRRQFLGAASAAAFPFIFPGCTGLNVRKYAANEKVNVGVIGIGRISTTMDIPLAIKYTDLCRFTAVCDLDSKRLAHGVDFIQQQYQKLTKEAKAPVKTFADYHDLLGVKGTEDYVSMCARKTGEAFALAAQLGALAAGAADEPYRRWGLAYGVLFQVNDDIADVGMSAALQALKTEWEGRLAAISRETGFSFTFPAIP